MQRTNIAPGDPDWPSSPALRARLQADGGRVLAPAAKPVAEVTPIPIPVKPPIADLIPLGVDERQKPFGIRLGRLFEGRLLIQGNSGAGKSWLLRKLLEESSTLVQQIVLDPEGEFHTLAEDFGHTLVDASRLDWSRLALLAGRVREHRTSIVLNLSQLDRDAQMLAATHFINGLVEQPIELWNPAVVAIDEAHLFAPFGGPAHDSRKASIAALIDLMSRGRKRGLAGVLATQRFARLSKSVSSEAMNFLIGINTLDLDIRRAAETIGWDARRAFDRLPMLDAGHFVAVGSAFPELPVIAAIGQVKSFHLGSTPAITPPSIGSGDLLDVDSLVQESEDAAGDDMRLPVGARATRDFIRDPAFPFAGRLYGALTPLYPEGSSLGSLAKHLGASLDELGAAVVLLTKWGAIETLGDPGAGLGLRIARNMRL